MAKILNLIRVNYATDAAGNRVDFTYDNNRLSKISLPQITIEDPNNLGTYIDACPEYRIWYNTYGQITDIRLPDGINIGYLYNSSPSSPWVETIVYDSGGNPYNLNLTYNISYDVKGNITSITDPDGIKTSYAYDIVNRLTEITDALSAKTKLNYNNAGLVDGVYRQLGASFNESTSKSAFFEYNTVDRLTKITDLIGRITQLTLDSNDNIAQVKDPQARASGYSTDYGYNAFDLVESITLPEDYDPARRLRPCRGQSERNVNHLLQRWACMDCYGRLWT